MAGNEFDPFDLDSFDFGDFDSLDTGVSVFLILYMTKQ